MEHRRILQELIDERDKLQRALEGFEEMALVAWVNFELRVQAVCHCVRCGHTWVKRTKAKPGYCPKCGQQNWDIPTGLRNDKR